jgi:hypothetical protein
MHACDAPDTVIGGADTGFAVAAAPASVRVHE